jgi:hypothetical protein
MGDYNYLFSEMPMLDDLLQVEPSFMPVSSEILEDTVDVLRAHIAGFDWPQGSGGEARAYLRVMSSTSAVLAGLLAAFATRGRHDAAYETLLLLQSFLQGPQAADHLEAIRGAADIDDEVVDALKTLHWQIQKRHMEQAAKPRRGLVDDSIAAAQLEPH